MTLPKAIEILLTELDAYPHKGSDDWYDAVRLSIEALKRVRAHRESSLTDAHILLSGETDA